MLTELNLRGISRYQREMKYINILLLLVEFYIKQKHQVDAHDLLRLGERHLDVELDVVQEAVPVEVLLSAGDQRHPDILQQEVVDGLRRCPAQLHPLPGSGQENQLVAEVDLGLLLIGGQPQPKSLGPVIRSYRELDRHCITCRQSRGGE